MIVKKVQTNKAAAPKSKALHVRDLCDYIAGPDAGDRDKGEKIEHRGSVNLLNIDHDGQVHEMSELAEAAKRSPQPVQHWILSWRQGEQPTPAKADQAVAILLDEMGLSQHQAIYALHRNTDNYHLHLAVNRVDPETERVITVNNGFDIEVAHRAIARIEHEQGWEREQRGRYQVLDHGIERADPDRTPIDREPRAQARDFENLTGQKSAQRIAIEDGAPIMRRARSWMDLHASLAERGMRFDQKGSGAILWVGETPVKASVAGRDCSMAAMEERLGDFKPRSLAFEPALRTPEPIAPALPGWDRYSEEKQAHHAARKRERALSAQRQREEWTRMTKQHRLERERALGGNWRGKGAALNATRSLLATRQAKEKAALKERLRHERTLERTQAPKLPGFESWLRERGTPDLADRWRFRERTPAVIIGVSDDRDDPAHSRDIRAFMGDVDSWGVVQYRSVDSPGRGPSFSDRGRKILIHDRSRESVLAALQLSAQKWGTFQVSGPKAFKHLCAELAAEHGFRITNPELQKDIAAERDRRQHGHRLAIARDVRPTRSAPDRDGVEDIDEAYQRHVKDIREQPGHAHDDESRLDAQVALRLRVTGYDQDDIEDAIRDGAKKQRSHERRNWGDYAKRTTDHAFGFSGDRDILDLAKSRDRLLAVEGRSPGRDLDLEIPFPGGRGLGM